MTKLEPSNCPTAQRLSQIGKGRMDTPRKDRTAAREFYRIVPIFELLERRGYIDRASRTAGETYAGYWHGARQSQRTISSYGDQRWSHSTGSKITEEWPIHCANEMAKAVQAIGAPRMIKMLDSVIEADATSQDVAGTLFPKIKDDAQRRAAGSAAIAGVLERLAHHFTHARGRP